MKYYLITFFVAIHISAYTAHTSVSIYNPNLIKYVITRDYDFSLIVDYNHAPYKKIRLYNPYKSVVLRLTTYSEDSQNDSMLYFILCDTNAIKLEITRYDRVEFKNMSFHNYRIGYLSKIRSIYHRDTILKYGMETLDSAASSLDFMFMKRYPMTDMAVVLLKHMYLCSPQDQLTQIESLYNSYPLGFLKFYGIDGLKNNFNVLPINPVVLKLLKKYNIHSSGRNLLLFVDTDCYFCKLWLKNKVQLDTVFDRVYIFILNKTDEFKGRRYIHVKHGEFNKYLAPLRICSVPYVLVTYGDIIEESDRANVVKRYNLKIE